MNNNESKLLTVVNIGNKVMDRLVSSNTDGLLSRPKTSEELNNFNNNVLEIIVNKLRSRIGV